MTRRSVLHVALVSLLFGGSLIGHTQAQVPPNIASELEKMGHIVDSACTARLYRPLMPANDITSKVTPLYPGHTITRNVSFGPDVKDVVDIMVADKGAPERPVLIYVPGGTGSKIEISDKAGNAFYDNIARWANDNGMVAVVMQRHPAREWNDGAKDVSAMIQWIQANISKYHGNPQRMFIWAHSAGNNPVGTYLGHPELHGPGGVGLKGAVLMSGQFNALPVQGPPNPNAGSANPFATSGLTCGAGTPNSDAGALPGQAPGTPGGPYPPQAAPLAPPAAPDPAVQLSRSSLPGLKASPVKLMLVSAELDNGVNGAMSPFLQALHDELCKVSADRCPNMLFAKGESHMSEVFAIGTSDTIVSGPILEWIKSVK